MEDPKFRTRLCNHWDTSFGTFCPMKKKNKCVFAHGPAELRVKEGKKNRWGKLVDKVRFIRMFITVIRGVVSIVCITDVLIEFFSSLLFRRTETTRILGTRAERTLMVQLVPLRKFERRRANGMPRRTKRRTKAKLPERKKPERLQPSKRLRQNQQGEVLGHDPFIQTHRHISKGITIQFLDTEENVCTKSFERGIVSDIYCVISLCIIPTSR